MSARSADPRAVSEDCPCYGGTLAKLVHPVVTMVLAVSSWELSESGPARKSYRLTPEGKKCFARWIETLENYHRAVGKLLSDARKARARGASSRRGGT